MIVKNVETTYKTTKQSQKQAIGMSEEIISSDVALLDLLRKHDSMSISQLAETMGVTATAIRQRLNRLMAKGYVDRSAVTSGRGRPSHRYALTAEGRRKTGANFADLAMALWKEVRAIEDEQVRRGLIQRISQHLASVYEHRVEGDSLEERMESLAALFKERQIPFQVDRERQLPVLTALACPYPDLAEQDRAVCAMERMMFSELLGDRVRLSECRLDGDSCCSFTTEPARNEV